MLLPLRRLKVSGAYKVGPLKCDGTPPGPHPLPSPPCPSLPCSFPARGLGEFGLVRATQVLLRPDAPQTLDFFLSQFRHITFPAP